MKVKIVLMRHNNDTDKEEYFTYKDIGTFTEVINNIIKFTCQFQSNGKPWTRWSVEEFTELED